MFAEVSVITGGGADTPDGPFYWQVNVAATDGSGEVAGFLESVPFVAGSTFTRRASVGPFPVIRRVRTITDAASYHAGAYYITAGYLGQTANAADVTALNTAKDTANVAGQPSGAFAAAAATASLQAAAATSQLAAIVSTGTLSRDKKPALITLVAGIGAEAPDIVAQLTAFGLSTVAFTAAQGALNTYLAALTPNWNDATRDTAIVAADFNAAFAGYYAAKQAALNAVAAQAGTQATGMTLAAAGGALTLNKGDRRERQRAGHGRRHRPELRRRRADRLFGRAAVGDQHGDVVDHRDRRAQRDLFGRADRQLRRRVDLGPRPGRDLRRLR